jgi:hypothetical protein
MIAAVSNTFQSRGNPSPPSKFSGHGTCLPSVGQTVRAVGLARLQHPWPSHNFRNTSPCLVGWVPSRRAGPFHPWPHCAASCLVCFVRRAHYEELCEVLAGRLRSARSSPPDKASLAGVAPARPQLRTALRPNGIGIVPHPMPFPATLRAALRPGSGPGFVPQPGPSLPAHQHRQGRGAHRVSVLASSSRIVSRCRRSVPASSGTFSTPDPYST